MRKLVYLLIASVLVLALFPAAVFAHTADDPFVTELIAGGGNEASAMDVGQVEVWNDDETLYVRYVVDDADWCLTETHLQVATSLGDIPQTKKGNPIPGQFDYNDMHDCIADYTYRIPLTWDSRTKLYIAAHAVVRTVDPIGFEGPNWDAFNAALPDQVTMSVQYPYSGGPSYFPETTVTGGTPLDGFYEGWCVDTDHTILQNTDYTAQVYSSYEDLPEGLVEFPENLDLVNWIINQGFVGQSSTCDGPYTYGDVQRAIWALIEDEQAPNGLGPWSQCRVDEILAAANASGEGFVPGCDDLIAILLVPTDTEQAQKQIIIAQVTLISVGTPCIPIYQDETAWGEGEDFPGKNWAMYFSYTVQSSG